MTIIPVSKRGTLKLPNDALAMLEGIDHFEVKTTSTGIKLTPVRIARKLSPKSVPHPPPALNPSGLPDDHRG